MNLEKAAGTSGDAGLAGWISSNDVTLFTMVLVVVIALFLQSNLVRRKKENKQLSSEKANLEANLTSTSSVLNQTSEELELTAEELAARKQQLAQTSTRLSTTELNLQQTQTQRDALDRNLRDAQGNISKLNAIIDTLGTEKTQLETERAKLTDTTAKLTQDRSTLTAEKAALAKDKLSLNERLASVTIDLENKLKALADVEKERENLRQRSADLDKIVATLQSKMQLKDEDLANMKASSAEQMAALQTQVVGERGKADKYLGQLRRAAELFRGMQATEKQLQGKVTNLRGELTEAELRHQNELLLKTKVNRELVGLQGPLKRVAILFDASGSMREEGTAGQGNRWLEAQEIALTWLTHLDVDEVVLIVFSSDVKTFPNNGTFAKVRGEEGKAQRAELLGELRRVQPNGWTNTYDAMRKAYEYKDLDTIVLLSDGAPTNVNSGTFDAAIARRIYELVQSHPGIPINTIGLGNYFDKNLATFLRTVARFSGGTFRGR